MALESQDSNAADAPAAGQAGEAGKFEPNVPAGTVADWPAEPDVKAAEPRRWLPWQLAALGAIVVVTGYLWLIASILMPETQVRNTADALLAGDIKNDDMLLTMEVRKPLTAEDLDFGEQQVERMVKDRPEMTRYVTKDDAVWHYCQSGFGGAVIGQHVFWDSSLPHQGYAAEHMWPYDGNHAFVRIREVWDAGPLKGIPLDCERLWSCAVFELENMRNYPGFSSLFDRAINGKLGRADWIRGNTKLEYQAFGRTAKLYAELWRPLARARGVRASEASETYWGVDLPATYKDWISLYTDPNSYPWDVYGREYDGRIAPYVRIRRWWSRW